MTEKKIRKLLKNFFGSCIKLQCTRRGVPDCIIEINGTAYFVEIKIEKDTLSKLQKKFVEKFYKNTIVLYYNEKEGFDYSGFLIEMDFFCIQENEKLKEKKND